MMAKKKKTATPSFDPGRFRQAEEASMAGFTPAQPAPVVDERTQVRAKLGLPPLEVSTTDTTEVPTMDPREGVKEIIGGAGSPTIVSRVDNGDGTFTITFSDGTVQTTGTKIITKSSSGGGKKVVSTYTDPETGDVIAVYDDGTTAILSKGTKQSDAARIAAEANAAKKARGETAFAIFRSFLDQFGLGALASDVEKYKLEGLSDDELLIRLRTESDAYKKRFAANQSRIARGLRALSEAEYIGLEDQYQDVMRRYGLPDTYYTRGDMGRQEGFEKFIGGDVSPVELEDRIQTAQRRVINAAPEITASLRSFYPEIGQGDLLAYFLDPDKAIENIKRKVTAAEIGGAATMAGLTTGAARAEELGRYGVTGEAARQGFQTIAGVLPRGSQLAEIYKQGPYTQTTAEQEVFGLAGAAEAGRQRRKLTELETAAFSGQAGAAGGALARDRAGAF